MSPKTYTVYVDGAVTGQQAPTGVGVVILDAYDRILIEAGFPAGIGTNQSAEIMAAIAGLRLVPSGSIVTVVSDSLYVVNTMSAGWARNANKDRWPLLDAEVARMQRVTWRHIRGHSNDPFNDRADRLAVLGKGQGDVAWLPIAPGNAAPPAAPPAPPAVQPVAPPSQPPSHDPRIERILHAAVATIANIALTRGDDPNLKLAVTTARRAEAEAAVLRRAAEDAAKGA